MKKIWITALLLCTLLTCCVLMSACGKGISEKDLKKDTIAVLNQTYENTIGEFFKDESGFDKVMESAMNKGSFNITVASDELMGGTLTKINETIYVDAKGSAFVSDTLVTVGGEDLSARIYGNNDALVLSSPSILGSDTAYALNFKTISEKFKDSALAKMMEISDEDMANVTAVINGLTASLSKVDAEQTEETEKFIKELSTLAKQTVSTETETVEDKEVKYLVVTYTINNEVVKAIVDKFVTEMGLSEILDEKEMTEFQDAIKKLDDMAEIDLSYKIYMDGKSEKIVKITMGGKIAVKGDDAADKQEFEVDATVLYSDVEISMNVKVKTPDETATLKLAILKEQTEAVTTYTLTANVGASGVTMDLLTATYSYDKKTGDITIEGKLGDMFAAMLDYVDDLKLTVRMNCQVKKDEAILKLVSVKVGPIDISFEDANEVSITVKAGVEVPAIPTDAKDIMDLTEDDWTKLGESIMTGKLGEIIGSIGSDDEDSDDDFEDNFDEDFDEDFEENQ